MRNAQEAQNLAKAHQCNAKTAWADAKKFKLGYLQDRHKESSLVTPFH